MIEIDEKTGIELVQVEGGSFMMGSKEGGSDEKPIHKVTLSGFSIAKYPVTVGQYKKYCQEVGRRMPFDEPDWGWKDDHPMVCVSWQEAADFCVWAGCRLPTEAEWEYAARGGTQSKDYKYSGGGELGAVGWYAENSGEETHPVGVKVANELGINDMSGNVWEWCLDWYGEDYYSKGQSDNPPGPAEGINHVIRGGSLGVPADNCRCATRGDLPMPWSMDVGFRVAR